MSHLSAALAHCLPELILAAGILVLVLFGALRGKESGGPVTEIAAGLLGLAIVIIFLGSKTTAVVFDGAFIDDGFGRFMKVLTLAGSLVTLIMSQDFLAREKIDKFEFPILILLSTLGMLMLISAAGLIALYLGLELMSLSLYVIAAFHRDNLRASEAGLKYFVLGALSSGMLLYGASLLYGFAGTVSFAGIAETINGKVSLGAIFGLVFLMAGLAFKMSAVPFHMWTPDVYEGAPTPVTAFFATAVKMAAVAITVRVVFTAFPGIVSQWRQIVIFISLLSMVLGAFAAIGQTNIKRLMAYSAIGHIGFALVGLAAGGEAGVSGVLAYMAIYLVMTRREYFRSIRSSQNRRRDGVLSRDDDVFPGGDTSARGLFRQMVCVQRGDPGGALLAGGHRRSIERGCCLLLSADRQGHVFRRGRASFRQACGGAARRADASRRAARQSAPCSR